MGVGEGGGSKITMAEFLPATVVASFSKEVMSSASGNFLFCFSIFFCSYFFLSRVLHPNLF